MPLVPGTRLGSYEIVAAIGAGGMGEVYRARDTRLNRDVAIKVLPDLFAADPERLARFEREARTLAALNHPNIAQIFGVEELPPSGDRPPNHLRQGFGGQEGGSHGVGVGSGSHGTVALVMEFVDGEDLATRIARGAIPIDDALPIARQIADAIEAAHEQGIIHRDLKPANIKVRPDGTVKVLDFGLAKALNPPESSGINVMNSPTITSPPAMSQLGVILGTAVYMAPEQARGHTVDKRADIWAFGCVLFEMLTGRQAFGGATTTDILGAIVHKEPDLAALPAGVPVRIRHLLRRCLRKPVKERLRDIGDARLEIDDAIAGPQDGAAVNRPANQSRTRLALAAAGIAGVILGGAAVWSLRPATSADHSRRVVRLAMPLPAATPLRGLRSIAIAISPDGTEVAYIAAHNGVREIFLRPIDGGDGHPLSGTQGAGNLFFSSDGQWLGFVADRHLKKIAVTGGAAVNLFNVMGSVFGAAWGPDNTIVFAPRFDGGLLQIPASGGPAQELTKPDARQNEAGHHWPQWLPGGDALLFTVIKAGGTWDEGSIDVQSRSTGVRRRLIQGGTFARYAASGHLVYIRAGTLMAAPFDLKRLDVTGPGVPVIEGVAESIIGAGQFAVADDGSLIYLAGGLQGALPTLDWVDRTGTAQPSGVSPQAYQLPRIAPDGRRIAVWIVGGARCDVAVYDPVQDAWTRLTFAADNHAPVWAPDGTRVAYQSNAAGSYELFSKPADGSGVADQLTHGAAGRAAEDASSGFAGSWTRDGRMLAYSRFDPVTAWDIWLLPMDGDRKPRPYLRTAAAELMPAFSPDGTWMAYVSDEMGRSEVFVRAVQGSGGQWQVSNGGGSEPVWASSGRELFYRYGESLMSVDVTSQPAFAAGKPKVLLTGLPESDAEIWGANYDVAPDGRRFLFVKEAGGEKPVTQINVVLDWVQELRKKR